MPAQDFAGYFQKQSERFKIPSYEAFYKTVYKSTPFFRDLQDSKGQKEAIKQCIIKKDKTFMALVGDQITQVLPEEFLKSPIDRLFPLDSKDDYTIVKTIANPPGGFLFRAIGQAIRRGPPNPAYELNVIFDDETTNILVLLTAYLPAFKEKLAEKQGEEIFLKNAISSQQIVHTGWLNAVVRRLQAAFNWFVDSPYYQVRTPKDFGKKAVSMQPYAKNYKNAKIDTLFMMARR